MIIDIFIVISQADRKAYEKFPEEINKTPPDKRKETKIYISITEERNIKSINTSMNQI
jgi:hypothetical protein